jgi:hypothetical protein
VVGVLVGQAVSAIRWERYVIVLGDPRELWQRRLLRLRAFGWCAIFLSAGQRALYRSARADWLVDIFTGACVVLGVLLVSMGFRLAKRMGQ